MQDSKGARAKKRQVFRKMAKDMARRYLRQMEVFNRRGLYNLGDLLSTVPQQIPPSKCKNLKKEVDDRQRQYNVSDKRRCDS